MRSVNTYGTFEDCISRSSPQTQGLARAVRKLVAEVYPEGLLEGAGKEFRHLKIQRPEDAARPALRELIREAVGERERALGAGG